MERKIIVDPKGPPKGHFIPKTQCFDVNHTVVESESNRPVLMSISLVNTPLRVMNRTAADPASCSRTSPVISSNLRTKGYPAVLCQNIQNIPYRLVSQTPNNPNQKLTMSGQLVNIHPNQFVKVGYQQQQHAYSNQQNRPSPCDDTPKGVLKHFYSTHNKGHSSSPGSSQNTAGMTKHENIPKSSGRSRKPKSIKISKKNLTALNVAADGDSKKKITPSSSVSNFLEQDILEKGTEVLESLDDQSLKILIRKVMELTNKMYGEYLSEQLVKHLGAEKYKEIANQGITPYSDFIAKRHLEVDKENVSPAAGTNEDYLISAFIRQNLSDAAVAKKNAGAVPGQGDLVFVKETAAMALQDKKTPNGKTGKDHAFVNYQIDESTMPEGSVEFKPISDGKKITTSSTSFIKLEETVTSCTLNIIRCDLKDKDQNVAGKFLDVERAVADTFISDKIAEFKRIGYSPPGDDLEEIFTFHNTDKINSLLPEKIFESPEEAEPIRTSLREISRPNNLLQVDGLEGNGMHEEVELPQEKVVGKEESQEKVLGKEVSREMVLGKEISQEKVIGKEISHKRLGKEISPEKVLGKEISHKKRLGKEISPEKVLGKEISHKKRLRKEVSLEKVLGNKEVSLAKKRGKEVSLEKLLGKEVSQEKVLGKEISQNKVLGKGVSYEKELGKEVAHENVIGKKLFDETVLLDDPQEEILQVNVPHGLQEDVSEQMMLEVIGHEEVVPHEYVLQQKSPLETLLHESDEKVLQEIMLHDKVVREKVCLKEMHHVPLDGSSPGKVTGGTVQIELADEKGIREQQHSTILLAGAGTSKAYKEPHKSRKQSFKNERRPYSIEKPRSGKQVAKNGDKYTTDPLLSSPSEHLENKSILSTSSSSSGSGKMFEVVTTPPERYLVPKKDKKNEECLKKNSISILKKTSSGQCDKGYDNSMKGSKPEVARPETTQMNVDGDKLLQEFLLSKNLGVTVEKIEDRRSIKADGPASCKISISRKSSSYTSTSKKLQTSVMTQKEGSTPLNPTVQKADKGINPQCSKNGGSSTKESTLKIQESAVMFQRSVVSEESPDRRQAREEDISVERNCQSSRNDKTCTEESVLKTQNKENYSVQLEADLDAKEENKDMKLKLSLTCSTNDESRANVSTFETENVALPQTEPNQRYTAHARTNPENIIPVMQASAEMNEPGVTKNPTFRSAQNLRGKPLPQDAIKLGALKKEEQKREDIASSDENLSAGKKAAREAATSPISDCTENLEKVELPEANISASRQLEVKVESPQMDNKSANKSSSNPEMSNKKDENSPNLETSMNDVAKLLVSLQDLPSSRKTSNASTISNESFELFAQTTVTSLVVDDGISIKDDDKNRDSHSKVAKATNEDDTPKEPAPNASEDVKTDGNIPDKNPDEDGVRDIAQLLIDFQHSTPNMSNVRLKKSEFVNKKGESLTDDDCILVDDGSSACAHPLQIEGKKDQSSSGSFKFNVTTTGDDNDDCVLLEVTSVPRQTIAKRNNSIKDYYPKPSKPVSIITVTKSLRTSFNIEKVPKMDLDTPTSSSKSRIVTSLPSNADTSKNTSGSTRSVSRLGRAASVPLVFDIETSKGLESLPRKPHVKRGLSRTPTSHSKNISLPEITIELARKTVASSSEKMALLQKGSSVDICQKRRTVSLVAVREPEKVKSTTECVKKTHEIQNDVENTSIPKTATSNVNIISCIKIEPRKEVVDLVEGRMSVQRAHVNVKSAPNEEDHDECVFVAASGPIVDTPISCKTGDNRIAPRSKRIEKFRRHYQRRYQKEQIETLSRTIRKRMRYVRRSYDHLEMLVLYESSGVAEAALDNSALHDKVKNLQTMGDHVNQLYLALKSRKLEGLRRYFQKRFMMQEKASFSIAKRRKNVAERKRSNTRLCIAMKNEDKSREDNKLFESPHYEDSMLIKPEKTYSKARRSLLKSILKSKDCARSYKDAASFAKSIYSRNICFVDEIRKSSLDRNANIEEENKSPESIVRSMVKYKDTPVSSLRNVKKTTVIPENFELVTVKAEKPPSPELIMVKQERPDSPEIVRKSDPQRRGQKRKAPDSKTPNNEESSTKRRRTLRGDVAAERTPTSKKSRASSVTPDVQRSYVLRSRSIGNRP